MLSTPSLSEPSAQLASPPVRHLGEGAQPFNHLALDIKALHQQTLITQASLQQLETQSISSPYDDVFSGNPWVLGVEGVLLTSGALILGALLGGRTRRRPQASAVFTEAGIANSHDHPHGQDQASPVPWSAASLMPEPVPAMDTEPEWFNCSEHDCETFAPQTGLESVLDRFFSTEQPDSFPPDLLASATDEAATLAPSAACRGFDPKAAATEVQRVRKSLARKRYVRNRAQVDVSAPITEPASVAIDLALDFDAETGSAPLLAAAHQNVRAQGDVLSGTDATPPEPSVDEPVSTMSDQLHPHVEGDDADAAVQLALAQEFEALGLWQGARELALEITKSSDANLKLQAQALLVSLMHEPERC